MPALTYLEKFIHPRWATPLEATKRVVGTMVMLLSITLVFAPIPLSNIVPALVIALISVAYLEEDRLVLLIAMLTAVIVLTVAFAALRQVVLGPNGSPTCGSAGTVGAPIKMQNHEKGLVSGVCSAKPSTREIEPNETRGRGPVAEQRRHRHCTDRDPDEKSHRRHVVAAHVVT